MLFKTSPPVLLSNGPAMICQPPTVFANELPGNTVLTHYARPDGPGVYWQGNEYVLDGTIGYDNITCEAVRTVSNYNGGSFYFNWHDTAATGIPANGREFLLMIDLATFTRTDERTLYFGEPYDWPPEFMINILGYQDGASGPSAFDIRYLQMDGSCYRPVYSGDGYYSAPNYIVSSGLPLFAISEIGTTADGTTYVCRFTMQNIDPLWDIGNNGVWIFGPVFPGSCRYALTEIV